MVFGDYSDTYATSSNATNAFQSASSDIARFKRCKIYAASEPIRMTG